MRFFRLCIIVLLVIFQTNIFAQISADKTVGCAPQVINFEYKSTATLTDINWDFGGDGFAANKLQCSHNFTVPKTYTVRFTAKNGNTPIDETLTIKIYDNPKIDFTVDTTRGCTGLAVKFTDKSKGTDGKSLAYWSWGFGDLQGSEVQSPTHIYKSASKFTVTLKGTDNNGCSYTKEVTEMIATSSPRARITSDSSFRACDPPYTIPLKGSNSLAIPGSDTIVSYKWDFTGGKTSTLKNPPAQTFSTTTTVQLTVKDVNHCQNTITQDITIGKPKASFFINNSTFPEGGATCRDITIYNTSPIDCIYNWDMGNSDTKITNDTTRFDYQYQNTGKLDNYKIKLTLKSPEGCVDIAEHSLAIENIIATFTQNKHYSCTNDLDVNYQSTSTTAKTWKWKFSGPDNIIKQTSTLEKPQMHYDYLQTKYSVNGPQYIEVKLVAETQHGCKDSIIIKKNDTIWKPNAAFLVSTASGCLPFDVAFKDTSFSQNKTTHALKVWDWQINGTKFSSAKDTIYTFNTAGEYNIVLRVKDNAGCEDTSYAVTIKVGDKLQPDFTVDKTSVCHGDVVTFTPTAFPDSNKVDVWHFETDGKLMSSCPFCPVQNWDFISDKAKHDVTLTVDYNGCLSTKTYPQMIEVKTAIAKIKTAKMSCGASCYNYTFESDSKGYDNLSWDFGDGTIDNSNNVSPTHTYDNTKIKNYRVILTAECSSCPNTKWHRDTIYVSPRKPLAAFKKDKADKLLCGDVKHEFDSKLSQQVNDSAYFGYVWRFKKDTVYNHTSSDSYDYLFDKSGNRTVFLEVKDVNGCIDTTSFGVQVYNVKAKFVTDKKIGCIPLEVNFTDSSKIEYVGSKGNLSNSWKWDFDNNSTSTIQNPTKIIFKKPTNFNIDDPSTHKFDITFIAIDSIGCDDTIHNNITVSVPDSRYSIENNVSTFCERKAVKFIPNSKILKGYKWGFGDKDTTFTLANNIYSHKYDTSGIFATKLIVVDSIKCKDSSFLSTKLNILPTPKPLYTVHKLTSTPGGFEYMGDERIICFGEGVTLVFTDSTIYNSSSTSKGIWESSDGIQNQDSARCIYDKNEVDSLILIVSEKNCYDTAKVVIKMVGPEAKMSISDSVICKGDEVTFSMTPMKFVDSYTWGFSDGSPVISNQQNTTHIYDSYFPQDTINASLTVSSMKATVGKDCNTTYKKKISMHRVYADFTINATPDTLVKHCLNLGDIFENKSLGAIDKWTISDGTTTKTNIVNHTFANKGKYDVELSVFDEAAGCRDTMRKAVIVNPLPEIKTEDARACQGAGKEIKVEAPLNSTVIWSPATGLSSISTSNPIATPSESTTYTVGVTDSNGCFSTEKLFLFIQQPIGPFDDLQDTIIIGESKTLGETTLGLENTYKWEPTDSLTCIDCPSPIANPQNHTLYTVEIQDTMKCFVPVTRTHYIHVLPYTSVDLPNAFTPATNDGNSKVFVRGWGIKRLLEFKIYNRYGELVFQTSDINQGWDGTYKGQPQGSESFVYTIVVEPFVGKENITKKGVITLLR